MKLAYPIMLATVLGTAAASAEPITRDQTMDELGRRLSDIQTTLNPAVASMEYGQMKSTFWTPERFSAALKKAEDTAKWITGNRFLKFSGITASASLPPSIDLHFDILPEQAEAKAP